MTYDEKLNEFRMLVENEKYAEALGFALDNKISMSNIFVICTNIIESQCNVLERSARNLHFGNNFQCHEKSACQQEEISHSEPIIPTAKRNA